MNQRRWRKIKGYTAGVLGVMAVGLAGGYEQSTTDKPHLAVLAIGCAVIMAVLVLSIEEDYR